MVRFRALRPSTGDAPILPSARRRSGNMHEICVVALDVESSGARDPDRASTIRRLSVPVEMNCLRFAGHSKSSVRHIDCERYPETLVFYRKRAFEME
jgi:hypothetical protein